MLRLVAHLLHAFVYTFSFVSICFICYTQATKTSHRVQEFKRLCYLMPNNCMAWHSAQLHDDGLDAETRAEFIQYARTFKAGLDAFLSQQDQELCVAVRRAAEEALTLQAQEAGS